MEVISTSTKPTCSIAPHFLNYFLIFMFVLFNTVIGLACVVCVSCREKCEKKSCSSDFLLICRIL